jgi:hypothetical protein
VKEILSKEFVHSFTSHKLDKWLGGFYISTLVKIETTASLESFRKFIIISTCRSFIPESYLRDYEVFPEREEGPGAIYIEAADKVTLKKIREMTFVNAKEILGIIYSSKSGNTQLKWRQTRRRIGKVQGFASPNALVDNYLKLIQNQQQQGQDPSSAVTTSEKTV